MAYLNAAMADGCAALSAKIEGGLAPRDAIAQMYDENMRVIFNGNGYSDEWPVEAAKRGLPNLTDTPTALATFNRWAGRALCFSLLSVACVCVVSVSRSPKILTRALPLATTRRARRHSDKNKALFEKFGVFTPKEVDARQEIMLEEYVNVLLIEARARAAPRASRALALSLRRALSPARVSRGYSPQLADGSPAGGDDGVDGEHRLHPRARRRPQGLRGHAARGRPPRGVRRGRDRGRGALEGAKPARGAFSRPRALSPRARARAAALGGS